MTYQTIEYAVADGVAELALNRPDKLNSFTTQMHEEVRDAMALMAADSSVRCLLLTARGRAFCAGQDLSDRAVAADGSKPDLGASLENNYNPLVRTFNSLQMPVIAAVNGVAAGAGANLALACDIVLAAESASFIQPFCRLGLVPDAGGTWALPRLVGRARALGLALLGDRLPAARAAEWGLIWSCLPDDQLMPEARKMARHLATQPTAGLALIKQAMRVSLDNSLDAQLDLERDLQRRAGQSDDYAEGVAAFLAKREPRFSGR